VDPHDFAERLPHELPGLVRYARALTRDPADADDLVQETLTRALDRAGSFRGDASLATWLHRILHNLAVDRVRRLREVPTEDVAEIAERQWRADSYTVDAAAVAARAEDRDELREALEHLPFDHRSAVMLHDMEGLASAEVARIQHVSLPAAKQRLRRGRMMLVSELARGAERRHDLKGVPMLCWEARRHVSDYLDGELEPVIAARVEKHLEACPTCPPLYAALVATTDAMRLTGRDPDTVVPPAIVHRLTSWSETFPGAEV
jgi:RNA polymerase sigma-70 factor (ECF subfamily)